MTRVAEHAVVLGAGMAGLAVAAVLAGRFDRVTIVERDTLPESVDFRGGVPQGRHVHILLPAGLRGLSEVLPGLIDDLRVSDAHVMHATDIRFHIADGRLLLDDADLEFVGATRPLLEAVVRDRVRALPGVHVLDNVHVYGLLTSADRSRVTGVRLEERDTNSRVLTTDLVVDATGRSSRAPNWLAALGYEPPAEERFHVGVHYTTRLFRREPRDLDGCEHLVVTIPRGSRRGGVALAVEGDRWIVTLIGLLGERPPADLDGFLDYARTLWVGDLHQLAAAATPIGEASIGGFPSYLRHRYDRVRRFPDRFVVTGDAVCSLSPLYAQGMSVAINEARALGQVLDRHGLDRVGRRVFQRTTRTVDDAWMMSTGADLGHPDVIGPRPAQWRLVNAYIDRLLRVAHHDPLVATAFMEVNAMVASPQHLMRPRIVWRAFTNRPKPVQPELDRPATKRAATQP
jgi:2-polyprenyl-6-methoxyphenol hydroxylase-like FAD-dependent oxidoreductase